MRGHTNLYVSVDMKEAVHEFKKKYRFRNNSEVLEALLKLARQQEKSLGKREFTKLLYSLLVSEDGEAEEVNRPVMESGSGKKISI